MDVVHYLPHEPHACSMHGTMGGLKMEQHERASEAYCIVIDITD